MHTGMFVYFGKKATLNVGNCLPLKEMPEGTTVCNVEGMHTGMFVYFGKKATLNVGNCLPLKEMPEGTTVCNVEEMPGDRGKLIRTSGGCGTIISHHVETNR